MKLPSELSNTSSNLYPTLKPLRNPSTSLSNVLDNTSEYTPSQNTTSSLFFTTTCSNSTLRLVRQHAQPLSFETNSSEFIPSPCFTSGFEIASLLSADAQTAFLSENLFSEVIIPTLVPAHIRIPEYYTADQSRPPTPNFADYPLRVDGITIYDLQNDPRFPMLPERFIANNDLLSQQEKRNRTKTPSDT